MTEHPILFTGDMVRAILDGRKTQTRRVIKPQPPQWWVPYWPAHEGDCIEAVHGDETYRLKSRCGNVGDLLWVRETTKSWWRAESSPPPYHSYRWTEYRADGKCIKTGSHYIHKNEDKPGKWNPSIFMPKVFCRLWLKVKSVREQQVQEITWRDIQAEGIVLVGDELVFNNQKQKRSLLKTKFRRLWDFCYAKPKPCYAKKQITHYESYPWEEGRKTLEHQGKPWHVYGNPHVFATEFERYDK